MIWDPFSFNRLRPIYASRRVQGRADLSPIGDRYLPMAKAAACQVRYHASRADVRTQVH